MKFEAIYPERKKGGREKNGEGKREEEEESEKREEREKREEKEEKEEREEREGCKGWVPVDLITECYRSRALFVSSLFLFIAVVFLGNAFGSGHSCEYTHIIDFEGLEERNVTCGIWGEEEEWKYSGQDDTGRVLGVSVSLAMAKFLFESMGNCVYHSPFWLLLSLVVDVLALMEQWGSVRLYCRNECLFVQFFRI